MNRNDLIRDLRKYARKNELKLSVDEKSGKGSHYLVKLGTEWTTIQNDLNPHRIERILKQLRIRMDDL